MWMSLSIYQRGCIQVALRVSTRQGQHGHCGARVCLAGSAHHQGQRTGVPDSVFVLQPHGHPERDLHGLFLV